MGWPMAVTATGIVFLARNSSTFVLLPPSPTYFSAPKCLLLLLPESLWAQIIDFQDVRSFILLLSSLLSGYHVGF